jgi:hypothetical protein
MTRRSNQLIRAQQWVAVASIYRKSFLRSHAQQSSKESSIQDDCFDRPFSLMVMKGNFRNPTIVPGERTITEADQEQANVRTTQLAKVVCSAGPNCHENPMKLTATKEPVTGIRQTFSHFSGATYIG